MTRQVEPVTLPLPTTHGKDIGTFTLTPVLTDIPTDTYLVSVDREAMSYHCGPTVAGMYAGRTIGGLAKVKAGWASVAYLDRDAWRRQEEDGWYAPYDAPNRAQAVRILLAYRWILHHPDYTIDLLVEKECRRR